ncbi:MAG: hypothetical protein OEV87_11630 [Phycisphaerae bacterium]|nr:hypothetical protein [Phycisphaerae bacterium]
MKKRPYNLRLQTPVGECEAAADTMAGLVEITPRGILGESERTTGPQESKLDVVSRELWTAFLERQKNKKRVQPSLISKAGCELDLMRCYLQGISIEEAADFLSELSGQKISHSAVGRYWRELNKIGMDFKARL